MEYRRPPLPGVTFLDAAGQPIPYGRRWPGAPDESTYSVTAHPERFAPLHAVADAVVDHLARTYDVRQEDLGPAEAARALGDLTGVTVLRGVRLVPAADHAAPAVLGWTDFFGVVARVGAACAVRAPFCGCDACDEDLDDCARSLEDALLAVAGGRLTEEPGPGGIRVRLDAPDGGSEETVEGDAVDRVALARLRALPDGWRPWPRRP